MLLQKSVLSTEPGLDDADCSLSTSTSKVKGTAI